MSVVDFPNAGEVVMARGPRSMDVPVATVLECAQPQADSLRQVLICGLTNDDSLYAAGSSNSVADTILLLERIKAHLMSKFSGDEFA